MVGIFPTTYVEIIPENEVATVRANQRAMANYSLNRPGSKGSNTQEGQAKAKFNFQAQTPMELSLVKGTVYRSTQTLLVRSPLVFHVYLGSRRNGDSCAPDRPQLV